MNIWLHRISHHAELSHPLLDRGYLSIGFSDFSNEEFLQRTQKQDWKHFDNAFRSEWGYLPPQRRHYLAHFVARMQMGDWVVVPSWKKFSLYKITSEATLPDKVDVRELKTRNSGEVIVSNGRFVANGSEIDLGFIRTVEPIAVGISRYDFADAALTERMKTRHATSNISGLRASVEKALNAFQLDPNQPINLHSQVVSSSRDRILKLIQGELNADKFERLIKWYFERLGASGVGIPPKNESGKAGDADIIATFEPLKTIFYVQAKHHEGKTSDWGAQQIHDYVDQKSASDDGYTKIGWVVTSGDGFSEKTKTLAEQNSIQLLAGPDLAQMILDVGIDGLDEAFTR